MTGKPWKARHLGVPALDIGPLGEVLRPHLDGISMSMQIKDTDHVRVEDREPVEEADGEDHMFREPHRQRSRCIRRLSQHQIGFVCYKQDEAYVFSCCIFKIIIGSRRSS